ncbi:ester cyclase [Salinicoccus sp. HZC-1]|uniref:ester cyclase n=1 Tax=Salinicoccus sp. HZC-1 TaxID=3385497 RepID=UPI00398B6A36
MQDTLFNFVSLSIMVTFFITRKYYFDDVEMTLAVGVIEDDKYVSVRWTFIAKYNGKIDSANANAGTEILLSGTDIFYIEDGKIKDYWVSSDGIDLMKQLGMF